MQLLDELTRRAVSWRAQLREMLAAGLIPSPDQPTSAGTHDRDDGRRAGGKSESGRFERGNADQREAGGQVKSLGDAESDAQSGERTGSGGDCDRGELPYA